MRPAALLCLASLSLFACSAPASDGAEDEAEGAATREETKLGSATFTFGQTKVVLTTTIDMNDMGVRATMTREGVEPKTGTCLIGRQVDYQSIGCSSNGMPVTEFILKRTPAGFTIELGERVFLSDAYTAHGLPGDHSKVTLAQTAKEGTDAFALIDYVNAALVPVGSRPSVLGNVTVETWFMTRDAELWPTLAYDKDGTVKRSSCYSSPIQPNLVSRINWTTQPTLATQAEITERTIKFMDAMVADISGTNGSSFCSLH